MQAFIVLLALFLSYKIFRNRNSYVSLLWVIVGLILLNGDIKVQFPIVYFTIGRWLIFSLFFVQLWQYKRFVREWKSFPLKKILIIFMIGALLVAFPDDRLTLLDKIYRPFLEITRTCFLLFLGYIAIKEKGDLMKMAKPLFVVLVIISVYGLLNYIFKTNPYYEWTINTFYQDHAHWELKQKVLDVGLERYRATSTFSMTFDYGYVSGLLSLFFFSFLHKSDKSKKNIMLFGIFSGLIGVVLSFSRSVMISVIAAFLVSFFPLNALKKIRIFILIVVVGVFAYSVIPAFQKQMDGIMDIFSTGGTGVSGSNVDMRSIQMAGTYFYFSQSPLRGNGYGYISNELGWGDGKEGAVDRDMYGFESIIFQLMIEQGIIGLLSKLLLFLGIIVFFFRNMRTNERLSYLGLSIVTLFLVYSIATGPLGAWPYTMAFLGAIIKTIVLSNKETDYQD